MNKRKIYSIKLKKLKDAKTFFSTIELENHKSSVDHNPFNSVSLDLNNNNVSQNFASGNKQISTIKNFSISLAPEEMKTVLFPFTILLVNKNSLEEICEIKFLDFNIGERDFNGTPSMINVTFSDDNNTIILMNNIN
jgi:hypothetical protein